MFKVCGKICVLVMFDFGCYMLKVWMDEFMVFYLDVMFGLILFDLLVDLIYDEIDLVICFGWLVDGLVVVCWFVVN